MKIRFFWYNGGDYARYRWALRGFAFDYPRYSANVHWISLLFLYGSNWRNKLINARRAWWTLVTLGRKI